MKEGNQRIRYQFMSEVDFSHKSTLLTSKIRQLKGLSHALHQSVNHELSESDGEVIKEIYKQIDEHTNNGKIYYEAAEKSMDNLTKQYENIVNSNRFQNITVHYDIIENDKA